MNNKQWFTLMGLIFFVYAKIDILSGDRMFGWMWIIMGTFYIISAQFDKTGNPATFTFTNEFIDSLIDMRKQRKAEKYQPVAKDIKK